MSNEVMVKRKQVSTLSPTLRLLTPAAYFRYLNPTGYHLKQQAVYSEYRERAETTQLQIE